MIELEIMSMTAEGNIGVYNARYAKNPHYYMFQLRMNYNKIKTYKEFTEYISSSIENTTFKIRFVRDWNKLMRKENIKFSDLIEKKDINDFCVLVFSNI